MNIRKDDRNKSKKQLKIGQDVFNHREKNENIFKLKKLPIIIIDCFSIIKKIIMVMIFLQIII